MYCSWKMRIAGSKISSLPVHFLLTVTTFVSQLFKIRQDFSPLLILICGEEFNMLNSYFYTYLVFTRYQIDLFEKQPAFAFSTFQRLNFQFQERFSYHPERDYHWATNQRIFLLQSGVVLGQLCRIAAFSASNLHIAWRAPGSFEAILHFNFMSVKNF